MVSTGGGLVNTVVNRQVLQNVGDFWLAEQLLASLGALRPVYLV
jgi:hypothetical protein